MLDIRSYVLLKYRSLPIVIFDTIFDLDVHLALGSPTIMICSLYWNWNSAVYFAVVPGYIAVVDIYNFLSLVFEVFFS